MQYKGRYMRDDVRDIIGLVVGMDGEGVLAWPQREAIARNGAERTGALDDLRDEIAAWCPRWVELFHRSEPNTKLRGLVEESLGELVGEIAAIWMHGERMGRVDNKAAGRMSIARVARCLVMSGMHWGDAVNLISDAFAYDLGPCEWWIAEEAIAELTEKAVDVAREAHQRVTAGGAA